jgi:O-antigen/teichoic acid export membrane protein
VSIAASAARGSAVTLMSQVVKLALSLASTILLARLLDPSDFGLLSMAVAIVGVAEILRDFGLSNAALQSKTLTVGQKSNLFWINTTLGTVLAGIVFLVAPLLAALYDQPLLIPIVQWLSLTFVFSGLATQFRVEINRSFRYFALNMCDVIPQALGLICALAIASTAGNYWALVVQQLVVAGSGLVLAIGFARWIPGLPKRRQEMRGLITYGVHLVGTQTISYATRNADNVGIGIVWGATSLGLYDRAYQLLMVPLNQVQAPLTKVALPTLARAASDRVMYIRYLTKAHRVYCYFTVTGFFFIAAIAPALVELLFGPRWVVAGQILAVLSLGGAFRSLVQIFYWVYLSLGLTREQLRFTLVAQPLLTVGILLGLIWGPMGVAVAHSIGYAIYWLVSLMWVARVAKLDMKSFLLDALRIVGLFGVPCGALAFLTQTWVSSPLLQVALGFAAVAVGATLSYLLLPATRQDFAEIRAFAKSARLRG